MSTSIQSLTPYLIVKNAREAIAFYGRAFGAEELFRLTDPHDGRIGHAELKLGENTVMIADEYPDFGALSPDTIGGSPVTFHLATLTVDANLARAVGAGAVVLRAAADQPYGERVAMVVDPFGHRWMLSQKIEVVAPEEMQRRWDEETGA
ncbi:VOC family protein [Rhizobium mongolense]|uniref:Glyoxalase/bleomycin resistance protein/dioxygenase family protein n=1 Tax=Rhizobium gallicum TaxID=56730 RepID=A0A1L5NEG8_9HYPH|nr:MULTISPECIES: VOC family protein [Rhizobium]APO66258.1 glyoxalase/bleomycin resistance protein/dioxygenase family protein [Rhizobium gallicum]QPB20137.1 VOC family protein [Rhizobium sp. 007]WFU87710.1 VOC family protein [Rhizobium sp. CC1099]